LLIKSPWWVSAGLGLLAFLGLKLVLPTVAAGNPIARSLALAGDTLAPIVLLFFGALSVLSALFAKKRRRLVDEQDSLDSLRATSWKDFEFLVAEAYRRQEYEVDYGLGRGADGGVDLTLRKHGGTTLVQCKQWKVFKIGAPVVRGLLGAMTSARADAGIVITTGAFTRDAREFAGANKITLVDGQALLSLVRTVQIPSPVRPAISTAGDDQTLPVPLCPSCAIPMVKRTARRGANAGSDFWGCSNYPRCRETLPLSRLPNPRATSASSAETSSST